MRIPRGHFLSAPVIYRRESILTGDSPTSDIVEDLLDLIRAGRGLVARIVCEGGPTAEKQRDALEVVVLDRVELQDHIYRFSAGSRFIITRKCKFMRFLYREIQI